MPITPTDEQQAICQAASGPDPLMIQAYAGTAKTTTICMAAPGIRVPALAVAFNKKIAEDFKGRLPGNFQAMTLNGLGLQAWAKGGLAPGARIEMDDRKLGKLVTQVAKDRRCQLGEAQWTWVRQLVAEAMQQGLVPAGSDSEGLIPDEPEQWQELGLGLGISQEQVELMGELARATLVESIGQARLGRLSFDDQIYCPTMLGGRWPKFPAIVVDESQDLSVLNRLQLGLSSRPDTKWMIVGDQLQGIYAWRGADSSSMEALRQLAPSWLDLGLKTTFRCPQVVVARQQRHAPGFRAWSGVKQGEFRRMARLQGDWLSGSNSGGWSWQELRASGSGSVAVLCRNNAPLLRLGFSLIRGGVAPQMLGRDLGKGLAQLARRALLADANADGLACAINEWEESESSQALAADRPQLVESIQDRAECLRAVLAGSGARDRAELLTALERLFANSQGDLVLSTIHRAKGLEWDVVMHLDPWRIPSKWAKGAAAMQEANLRYVAETRTRDVLVEGNLEDWRGA